MKSPALEDVTVQSPSKNADGISVATLNCSGVAAVVGKAAAIMSYGTRMAILETDTVWAYGM